MIESWREIKGYEGLYEVSNLGRVRGLSRYTTRRNGRKHWTEGRILKPRYCGNYLQVSLSSNDIAKNFKVHRLVGVVFADMVDWTEDAKGRPFEELQINHKDENPVNNRVENLEWCTRDYNLNYGTAIKRRTETLVNGVCAKKLYQYSLDGKLVKVWPSLAECVRHTGWSQGYISSVCNGKGKTYKGFRWKYNKKI